MWRAVLLLSSPPLLHAQPYFPSFLRPTASLDGHWQFHFDPDYGDVLGPISPGSIRTPERASVPSAFDIIQPGVPGRRGTAFYRRDVTFLPQSHRGRLQFAACAFYCRVFVDEMEIGEHRAGGYSPFWLDVPPSARAVRTILVIADNRFNSTTAPTHTGGDFYMYGGLTRSVTMHDLGPPSRGAYIDFLGVIPLNQTSVNVTLLLRDAEGSQQVRLAVDTGKPAGEMKAVAIARIGGLASGSVKLQLPDAKPWSPASPNLHTITAQLANGDAAVARFGLRTLSVGSHGRGITLNGAPIQLKGVNRHTMSAASGSALSLEEVKRDVRLLRELGVNYVRGAHYPQDQRFLDLCDEAGILVWEETLGPDVSTSDIHSAAFMKAQLQQVDEMVRASFSHPSVIIHGFFNEGPSNDPRACKGYDASVAAIRSLVPSSHRLVTWASSAKENDVCLAAADVCSSNLGEACHLGQKSVPIKALFDF
ncbi:MAG: hypothetical protein SGPRY_000266 [Prymnesium sp.]